jgi:ribosomal RNA assembly protein
MEDMARIPKSKIGILIGPNGSTKKEIESIFNVSLNISEDGSVLIQGDDGLMLWQATKAVKAIGRGFNLDTIKELVKPNYEYSSINLEQVVGRKKDVIERYKGRIIGQGGKTKGYIEAGTETNICLSGKTVGIIGESQNVHNAIEAIKIILDGAEIKTVYSYLHKIKKEKQESDLFGH